MEFNQLNAILSNPSWDIVVVFLFIAVGFFYGISGGKAKLVSLLVSLYVGGFFFENFFYIDYLIDGKTIIETFLLKIFIFAVIVLALNVLFLRIFTNDFKSGAREWKHSLFLSFLASGLLFSFIMHLFPVKEIFTFSPAVEYLFASDKAFFWWLLAPLAALFLIRK